MRFLVPEIALVLHNPSCISDPSSMNPQQQSEQKMLSLHTCCVPQLSTRTGTESVQARKSRNFKGVKNRRSTRLETHLKADLLVVFGNHFHTEKVSTDGALVDVAEFLHDVSENFWSVFLLSSSSKHPAFSLLYLCSRDVLPTLCTKRAKSAKESKKRRRKKCRGNRSGIGPT